MDTNAASLGKEQDFPSTVQWKHHGSPCSRVPRGVEGFGEDKNQNSTSSKLGAFAEPCPFPLVLEMLPDPSGTISPSSFRCFSPTLPLSQLISWQWPCPVLKSLEISCHGQYPTQQDCSLNFTQTCAQSFLHFIPADINYILSLFSPCPLIPAAGKRARLMERAGA